jgi:hypothetical protein
MEETETGVTVAKPVLTKEDLARIKNCDFYQKAKQIIKSAQDYKDYEIGSAIFVLHKSSNKMVCSDYEGKFPEKFVIVQNDDGFLFVKRINANGKPGVAITCVTIDYPSEHYELRVDDGYVEAMLLDTQDQYDPASDAKNLAKRKNKASRENGKMRVLFDTGIEAYNYLKTISIGDVFYSSDYSYGYGVTEYKVDSIDKRPAKGSNGSWSYRSDDDYLAMGVSEVIEVKLKAISSTSKYMYDKTLKYTMISKENYPHFLYNRKPISPEDLAQ